MKMLKEIVGIVLTVSFIITANGYSFEDKGRLRLPIIKEDRRRQRAALERASNEEEGYAHITLASYIVNADYRKAVIEIFKRAIAGYEESYEESKDYNDMNRLARKALIDAKRKIEEGELIPTNARWWHIFIVNAMAFSEVIADLNVLLEERLEEINKSAELRLYNRSVQAATGL